MSDRFPGLGFDPAPGEPEEVRRLARQHVRVAAELAGVADELGRVGESTSSWRGVAATAFAGALVPPVGQLRAAAEAFGATAARLSAWAGELEELQAEARVHVRAATAALDRIRTAHALATSPGASVLTGGSLHGVDVADAEQDLRRATWAGDDVRDRWRAGGRRVAAALRAAAESAPPVPASLGELVWRYRREISAVADLFSVVTLPVGLVPVAGPPTAAVLGITSTAGRAALAAYADGSTTDVALGALGVGLGGASTVATHAVRSPATGAATRATARSLQVGDVGYGAAGTAMTVHKRRAGPAAPAPAPPAGGTTTTGPAPARPSPALRRLLVEPVTQEPRRKDS